MALGDSPCALLVLLWLGAIGEVVGASLVMVHALVQSLLAPGAIVSASVASCGVAHTCSSTPAQKRAGGRARHGSKAGARGRGDAPSCSSSLSGRSDASPRTACAAMAAPKEAGAKALERRSHEEELAFETALEAACRSVGRPLPALQSRKHLSLPLPTSKVLHVTSMTAADPLIFKAARRSPSHAACRGLRRARRPEAVSRDRPGSGARRPPCAEPATRHATHVI